MLAKGKRAKGEGVRTLILRYIIDAMEQNDGRSPTVQEICTGVHIDSKSHVHHHLKALEREGYIERAGHEARGIKVVKGTNGEPLVWKKQSILPLKGTIAAGQPLPNLDEPAQDTITLELSDLPTGAFALRIKGNSMVEDGIFDGDYLIAEPRQPQIENGTTIIAVHADTLSSGLGHATVKRFYREPDGVRLQPANPLIEPIYISGSEWENEWIVRAKVIDLYRRYI